MSRLKKIGLVLALTLGLLTSLAPAGPSLPVAQADEAAAFVAGAPSGVSTVALAQVAQDVAPAAAPQGRLIIIIIIIIVIIIIIIIIFRRRR